MIFTSLLYSLRNSTNQWGGATVGMSIFHIQTSGCTDDKITSERLDLRILLKQKEFKGKGAERLHTG